MDEVVEKVQDLGYEFMTSVVTSEKIPGFKFTYFRGPDGMMVELYEGICEIPKGMKDVAKNGTL